MNNRWRQIEKIRKRALIREKRLERMYRIIINEPKLQAILSANQMCHDSDQMFVYASLRKPQDPLIQARLSLKRMYERRDVEVSNALRSKLMKEKMRLICGGDENE